MILRTFEDYLDELLLEKKDYNAYEEALKEGREKFYDLAESWLKVSKFNTEERDAWFEHHGHYDMSAIVYFASIIQSRRALEAREKLKNIKLAVDFLKSEGIDVTIPMLLNGSTKSEELLELALRIIPTYQTPEDGSSSSFEDKTKKEMRNIFLKAMINSKLIKLDEDGCCDLKQEDLWYKLFETYQRIIDDVKNKNVPSSKSQAKVHRYITSVNSSNIFSAGKSDFFHSSKNPPIEEIIGFKPGRKPKSK